MQPPYGAAPEPDDPGSQERQQGKQVEPRERAPSVAQAILVSNLDMIIAVLDSLEIPHQDGFFDKDLDSSEIFTDNWRQQAFDQFKDSYPEPVLVFYINHLAWELAQAEDLFTPTGKS